MTATWFYLFLFGTAFVIQGGDGQLGYSSYQTVMGTGGQQQIPGQQAPYPGAGGPGYGNGGYSPYGFSYNPQVGVVGPQTPGGGYEALGVGQYPFLDPKTYWLFAGVSGAPSTSDLANHCVTVAGVLCGLALIRIN